MKQQTLKYVNYMNSPDASFTMQLKRQQASRTVRRLLRASVTATASTTFKVYCRVYSDINETNHYENMYVNPPAKIEPPVVRRNVYGQFISV